MFVPSFLRFISDFLLIKIRHNNALSYVTKAIDLLTETDDNNLDDPNTNKGIIMGISTETNNLVTGDDVNERKIYTLGIAYYNMAVEFEHLKKYSDCIEAYESGIKAIEGKFTTNHPIYQTLLKGYNNVKLKRNQIINKRINNKSFSNNRTYDERPMTKIESRSHSNYRSTSETTGNSLYLNRPITTFKKIRSLHCTF